MNIRPFHRFIIIATALSCCSFNQYANAAPAVNMKNLSPADLKVTTPVIPASPPPPTTQVMPADTFKSTTAQLGQQTQSGLTSQLSGELAKQPPVPPQPEPKQPATDTGNNTTGKNAGQTSPATKIQQPSSRLSAPAKTTAPAESKSNNTYTGFGSGGSNSSTPASTSSGSGGGWNVQY